jgi:hypothetical protein
MQNKIIQYLQENGGTATSIELVANVLKIQAPSQQLADQLVTTAVGSSALVCQNNLGEWNLAEAKTPFPENLEFCLIVVLPERVSFWSQWQAAAFAVYDGNSWGNKTILENIETQTITQKLAGLLEHNPEIPLFVPGFGNQQSQLNFMKRLDTNLSNRNSYSMIQLAQQIFPSEDITTRESMCTKLGLFCYDFFDIGTYLNESIDQLQELQVYLKQTGISSYAELFEFYQGTKLEVSFENYNFDRTFLKSLPQTPGVYQMENKNSEIIYIGKAKNLQQRVTSYFVQALAGDAKLERIRRELYFIKTISTGSELEALLLEQEQIERYNPPINTLLNVHSRSHRIKNRFPQMVILQAAAKEEFRVYLLSPQNGFKVLNVHPDRFDKGAIKSEINEHFFNQNSLKEKQKFELAMSWTSQNSDCINTIDMRKIASPKKATDILKSQIANLANEYENIVQYA